MVFPAHAGMFRLLNLGGISIMCFPRARGDVPQYVTSSRLRKRFSPRTRGCSAYEVFHCKSNCVFPAHAGMFPKTHHWFWLPARFPRARGDVPKGVTASTRLIKFSPRTRGCSELGYLAENL